MKKILEQKLDSLLNYGFFDDKQKNIILSSSDDDQRKWLSFLEINNKKWEKLIELLSSSTSFDKEEKNNILAYFKQNIWEIDTILQLLAQEQKKTLINLNNYGEDMQNIVNNLLSNKKE